MAVTSKSAPAAAPPRQDYDSLLGGLGSLDLSSSALLPTASTSNRLGSAAQTATLVPGVPSSAPSKGPFRGVCF